MRRRFSEATRMRCSLRVHPQIPKYGDSGQRLAALRMTHRPESGEFDAAEVFARMDDLRAPDQTGAASPQEMLDLYNEPWG